MEKVKYEMEIGKEGKEMVDAIAVLVQHFIKGGDIVGATQHLGEVAKAVDGAAGVVDEIKSEYNDELAGYLVHKVLGALKS